MIKQIVSRTWLAGLDKTVPKHPVKTKRNDAVEDNDNVKKNYLQWNSSVNSNEGKKVNKTLGLRVLSRPKETQQLINKLVVKLIYYKQNCILKMSISSPSINDGLHLLWHGLVELLHVLFKPFEQFFQTYFWIINLVLRVTFKQIKLEMPGWSHFKDLFRTFPTVTNLFVNLFRNN